MKLSILLCSLPNRLKPFSVIEELTKQANEVKDKSVEVIYLGDNWNWTVGEKRNKLVSLASGKYIVFVDDDDRISPDYVSEILEAIESDADCITFQASVSLDNGPAKLCLYSKLYNDINTPEFYYRKPDQKMVWRKSIVCDFIPVNIGEDFHFANQMKDYSEYNINKVLYYYDFNSKTTEAQKK